MTKHAIFDVDGTLLDSMYIWENLGEMYLEGQGLTPPPDLREQLRVMTLPQAAQYFISYYRFPKSVQQVVDDICAIIDAEYRDRVQLKPGAADYLKRLHKSGARLAVVTASEYDHVRAAFRRLGILPYFDCILTCTDTGCSKAEPRIFQMAAERLGGIPAETTVFEDAVHCAETAKRAGFRVVGVYDPATGDEGAARLRALCDRYIMSYCELEGLG